MARSSKVLISAAAIAALCKLQGAFVPTPAGRTVPGVSAACAAMLGASPAYADAIDDAAKKLSEASYPFLKSIDWSSDVYAKLPTQEPAAVMKAVDAMLKMGAAMDGTALQTGTLAHTDAIAHMDSKLVCTLSDYTAINAAIGHMVASAGRTKTMDVYNAIADFNLGSNVGPYMMSKVSQSDAVAAYSAFLKFKDTVQAAQR